MGAVSAALDARFKELTTAKAVQKFEFYPDGYTPPATLEDFLLQLAESAHTFKSSNGRFEAPDFNDSMPSLVISCKLFVQDRVASGAQLSPAHLFALHTYTLYCSIFKDACKAMRELDWPTIKVCV